MTQYYDRQDQYSTVTAHDLFLQNTVADRVCLHTCQANDVTVVWQGSEGIYLPLEPLRQETKSTSQMIRSASNRLRYGLYSSSCGLGHEPLLQTT